MLWVEGGQTIEVWPMRKIICPVAVNPPHVLYIPSTVSARCNGLYEVAGAQPESALEGRRDVGIIAGSHCLLPEKAGIALALEKTRNELFARSQIEVRWCGGRLPWPGRVHGLPWTWWKVK